VTLNFKNILKVAGIALAAVAVANRVVVIRNLVQG